MSIIDEVARMKKESLAKRLAWVGAFQTSMLTNIERNANKPFNPLLHETYEF